ncbi:DUF3302 domain-containing protein [Roseibium sp. M-1]
MGLIDFELDAYDYLTFAILLGGVIAFFYVMITLGGLPGKLAEQRKHPHAESVKLGGWIGLFTVFPWFHALMWAYHDSMTVDIRKMPKGGETEGAQDTGTGVETLEATSVPKPRPEAETEEVLPPGTPRDGGAA